MSIKRVWRDDTINTCVACKICQSFAPRVFRVFDKMIVMPGVNYSLYEEEILEAVKSCPTGIIKIEYLMKVAVWDTYVKKEDGDVMHFDIIVPESLKTDEIVFNYGREYLIAKGIEKVVLTSNECEFCHIEDASAEIVQDIKLKGYHIVELKNCKI